MKTVSLCQTDNAVRLRRVSQAQRHAGSSRVWSRAVVRPAVWDSALLSRHFRPRSQTDGHCLRHSKVRD